MFEVNFTIELFHVSIKRIYILYFTCPIRSPFSLNMKYDVFSSVPRPFVFLLQFIHLSFAAHPCFLPRHSQDPSHLHCSTRLREREKELQGKSIIYRKAPGNGEWWCCTSLARKKNTSGSTLCEGNRFEGRGIVKTRFFYSTRRCECVGTVEVCGRVVVARE